MNMQARNPDHVPAPYDPAGALAGIPPLTLPDRPSVIKVLEAQRDFQSACHATLQKDLHYGPPFPGSDKSTMLKPGAEAVCQMLQLSPSFRDDMVVEDFDRPLFAYRVVCRLNRIADGLYVGEASGSCSSMESRYRYRTGERVCPECGKASIIKGQEKFGGGWLCWKNHKIIPGCGATWPDGTREIEGQAVGRMENPDIADQWHTIRAIAEKRAYVAATRLVAALSAVFDAENEHDQARAVETATGEVIDQTQPQPRPPRKETAPKNSQAPKEPWYVGVATQAQALYGYDETFCLEIVGAETWEEASQSTPPSGVWAQIVAFAEAQSAEHGADFDSTFPQQSEPGLYPPAES